MQHQAFNCTKYNINHITTVDQVKDFANYLVNDLKVNIHPDNDFSEYIEYSTGKNTFNSKEVERGNQLMAECCYVCQANNIDVYELMSEYLFTV